MATTYVVMQNISGQHVVLGTASGDTPREAVKVYSEPESGPVQGHYVLVPVRNWSEEIAQPEVRVAYQSRGFTGNGEEPETVDPQPEDEQAELAAAIEDDES